MNDFNMKFIFSYTEEISYIEKTFQSSLTAFYSTLSTRDIAIFIWACIIITLILYSNQTRKSALQLIKAALQKNLITIYIAISTYTTFILFLLNKIGLYTIYQLKYALIWIFAVGFVPLIKMKKFQDDMIRNAFSLAKSGWTLLALFSFFISLYPFSFYIEFFILFPGALLLGAILALADNGNYRHASKTANSIISIALIFIIIRTIYDIFQNHDNYFNQQVLLNYISVSILTVMYIPFMISLTMLIAYENLFIIINIHIKNRTVSIYSKLFSILFFNFNINLAKRWGRLVARTKPKTIRDINASIFRMRQIWRSEKFPRPVQLAEGWLPQKARRFLEEYQLNVSDYDLVSDNVFSASAIKTSEDPNSLIQYYYSLRGVEGVVKILKLTLSAFNISKHPEQSETKGQAIEEFLLLANTLWRQANGDNLPSQFSESIRNCSEIELVQGSQNIKFQYILMDHSYEMALIIQAAQWAESD